MSGISVKMLKVGAVVGAPPAVLVGLGYRMRSGQASERRGEAKVYRVCDLPLVAVNAKAQTSYAEVYPRNDVEAKIGDMRKSAPVQGLISGCKTTRDYIQVMFGTGVEQGKSTIDYIQNSPSQVAKAVAVLLSGSVGVVLGYRGTIMRQAVFGSIGAVSMAALAWPKQSVYIVETGYYHTTSRLPPLPSWMPGSQDSSEDVNSSKEEVSKEAANKSPEEPSTPSKAALEGDPGQSNPADTDMYSTRSS